MHTKAEEVFTYSDEGLLVRRLSGRLVGRAVFEDSVGAFIWGAVVGFFVEAFVGLLVVGAALGALVGLAVVWNVGLLNGLLDGTSLGSLDGVMLGLLDGLLDGNSLGSLNRVLIGLLDGLLDGFSLKSLELVGDSVGLFVRPKCEITTT